MGSNVRSLFLFLLLRQKETDIYEWSAEELLEVILRRLEEKKYSEVHGLIIAARDRDIVDMYLELFPAIIEKYDEEFVRNGSVDPVLEEILILVKSYGATKEKLVSPQNYRNVSDIRLLFPFQGFI